ncbi:hypothetical protein EVJ58_g4588 [Rhodofomes roseus]|nr:hypothetical protein EVJ58_g4588 [Rhodofomes roseus]
MSTILVMLRPTEDDDIYFLSVGGHVDHAKIVAERAGLERVLKVGTGRMDIVLGKIRYVTEYRPHVRMAETFRKGRVFVAGDAAHIHSPFGGQGLNSSVQDAVNLGWKLSLVEKGVAAPSLLDSYSEERIPVITEMLKKSTELFDNAMQAKSDGTNSEKAWYRGGELHMFGVNCRWSSIVVDERTPKEKTPVDPYGVESCSYTNAVRAGDRAPDAPGLVVLDSAEDTGMPQGTTSTSLFNIFGPSYHTALIFSDGTDSDKAKQIVSQLRAYPPELVRKVLVYHDPDGTPPVVTLGGADMSVVDRYGHAHGSYQVRWNEFVAIVVRPDGGIGGIIRSTEGLKRYFDGIFSAT